jgi:hypothetical protein
VTTIEIDERGVLTVAIPVTKDGEPGEPKSYELRLAPPGFSEWACTLTRLDTGSTYRVAREATGAWRCQCEDNTYKGYRKRNAPECKHITAGRGLYALCRVLAQEPQGVPA